MADLYADVHIVPTPEWGRSVVHSGQPVSVGAAGMVVGRV